MELIFWINIVVWIIAVYWQLNFGSTNSSETYRQENKKVNFLNPPSWLFGPVWFVLYGLMAAAIILYTTREGEEIVECTMIFILVNLLLNKLWTPLFFGLRQRLIALLVLIGMDVLNILTLIRFCREEYAMISFWLWLPYTIWCFYATLLNFARVLRKKKKTKINC